MSVRACMSVCVGEWDRECVSMLKDVCECMLKVWECVCLCE